MARKLFRTGFYLLLHRLLRRFGATFVERAERLLLDLDLFVVSLCSRRQLLQTQRILVLQIHSVQLSLRHQRLS